MSERNKLKACFHPWTCVLSRVMMWFQALWHWWPGRHNTTAGRDHPRTDPKALWTEENKHPRSWGAAWGEKGEWKKDNIINTLHMSLVQVPVHIVEKIWFWFAVCLALQNRQQTSPNNAVKFVSVLLLHWTSLWGVSHFKLARTLGPIYI